MIHIYEPFIATNQKKYVNEALDKNQLSYRGEFVCKFENKLKEVLNCKNAIAVSNGSVSLYAIYHEVFPKIMKTYVLVPTITYAATVSQLKLLGYIPFYIDCDENLQMDLNQLKIAINGGNVCGVEEEGG